MRVLSMKKDYERITTESHSDVVEELGHEFDDVAVLGGLGLQQLLDHHHALSHHRLCKGGRADFRAKLESSSARRIRHRLSVPSVFEATAPKKGFYRLCWTAAAPGRSDTCPSPRRCWWRSSRWPGWWRPQTTCPGSSRRSAGRGRGVENGKKRREELFNGRPKEGAECGLHHKITDNKPTWNSRRIVEMLASLARLVKISNCNNHNVRGSGTLEGSVETIQKCA